MDQTISSNDRHHWTTEDVRRTVEGSKVVVFAKGTEEHPRCGFSEKVIHAIADCGRPYEVVDVSEDRSILPAVKAYSGQGYLPLVFVDGKLVSSSENQQSLMDNGSLRDSIELAYSK